MKRYISLFVFLSLFLSLSSCTSNSGSPAPTSAIFTPKFDGDGVMGNKERNYIAYTQGATVARVVSLQKEETKAFRFTKEFNKPIEAKGEVALNLIQRSSDGKSIQVQGDAQVYHLVQASLKEVDANLPAVLATLPSTPAFVPYSGPPGSNDNTFGGGQGYVIEGFSLTSHFTDVLVMSDGKILVAGTTDKVLLLKRFLPDGSPDLSFGTNGSVTSTNCLRSSTPTDYLSYRGGTRGLAVQSDGKIIAGCLGGYYSWIPVPNIARFHSNGSIDTTFSSNGYGYYDTPDSGSTRGIKVDILDSIYFLSEDTNTNRQHITYLNSAGQKASSFTVPLSTSPGFSIDSLLRVYITSGTGFTGGRIDVGSSNISTAYEQLSGTPTSFETRDILVQPDNKVLLLGHEVTKYSWNVSRYIESGNLDSAFGTNGVASIGLDGHVLVGNALALQNDGKVIIGGGTLSPTNNAAFGRLLPNGEKDTSFGTLGFNILTGTPLTHIYDVAIQPDGRIIGIGMTAEKSTAIVRINP